MNYRRLYEKINGSIPDGYEVHHIDWNHSNNDINNLIAIPKMLHVLIHSKIGYVDRCECEMLTELYKQNLLK